MERKEKVVSCVPTARHCLGQLCTYWAFMNVSEAELISEQLRIPDRIQVHTADGYIPMHSKCGLVSSLLSPYEDAFSKIGTIKCSSEVSNKWVVVNA